MNALDQNTPNDMIPKFDFSWIQNIPMVLVGGMVFMMLYMGWSNTRRR